MPDVTSNLAFYGYGVAAVLYLLVAFLVLANWKGQQKGGLLALAVIATAIWGAGLAYSEVSLSIDWIHIYFLEIGRDACWLLFLAEALNKAAGGNLVRMLRLGGPAIAIALIGTGLLSNTNLLAPGTFGSPDLLELGSLVTSLFVIVYLEQLFRNAGGEERKGLTYFCVGIGAMFVYDVVLYSDALVAAHVSELMWDVRGFVVIMGVPLVAIGIRHIETWSGRLFVSRHVVFYTTTLVAAGAYLVAVGVAGYYVRMIGGQWGAVFQVLFVSVALLSLALLLFSDLLRAKLRVFISKHFFENKYDYREEWLRLIATLSKEDENLPLKQRSIKALGQILSAGSGRLWVKSGEGDEFTAEASWNAPRIGHSLAATSGLVTYLSRSGWMIDVDEFKSDPRRYEGLQAADLDNLLDDLAFVVPLQSGKELFGFVALSKTATPVSLNYEDRDLLKTAGRQIASYLGQEMATEQLMQSRQFEAFNKLTAYIMHDLKNLISQQSLVVENAKKYKSNPEFIDDAVATIEGGVLRMRRVIDQLQQTSPQRHNEKVDLNKLVIEAVSRCSDKTPQPVASCSESEAVVVSNRERLLMALCHTIRNAQEATSDNGMVQVAVEQNADEIRVSVNDNGRGMDEEFVRERLFKPFDSTKGTQGMGIGAFQVRETIRSSGGHVEVSSKPGEGTQFTFVMRRFR